MRILSVHNRYLLRGGEDGSRHAEEQLLREHGHDVISYEESNERIAELGRLRTAARTVWSRESYRMVDDIIDRHRPDVMHVQNYFPLVSPSVYYAAAKQGVPVVQSLRNYRLICLGGQLLRRGQVCEDCFGKRVPWPGIVHKCYRNSVTASAVTGAMLFTHARMGTWERKVTRYIALTEFARAKLIEGGLPPERISVKANFLPRDPGEGEGKRAGALFVGRLSPEKGVHVLLDAWDRMSDAPSLTVVGSGPLEHELRQRMSGRTCVQFLGDQPTDVVLNNMKRARYLVFPSVWYEGMPRTIIEAMACGTPVLASRLGSMQEMVGDEKNGLLFEAGQSAALAAAVTRAEQDEALCIRLGANARKAFLTHYTAEHNYERVMEIYKSALNNER